MLIIILSTPNVSTMREDPLFHYYDLFTIEFLKMHDDDILGMIILGKKPALAA